VSLLGEPLALLVVAARCFCFLTIFFIFLTPPFFTGGDDDDAPFMGCRLVDVLAAAPPRVVNFSLLLLCTDDDDEVEPADDKFQGSRRDPKMPRPLDDDDCTALTTLSVIEMTATRQTPSAVAVYCRPILMMHVLCVV